jgi:hypothetical protein
MENKAICVSIDGEVGALFPFFEKKKLKTYLCASFTYGEFLFEKMGTRCIYKHHRIPVMFKYTPQETKRTNQGRPIYTVHCQLCFFVLFLVMWSDYGFEFCGMVDAFSFKLLYFSKEFIVFSLYFLCGKHRSTVRRVSTRYLLIQHIETSWELGCL